MDKDVETETKRAEWYQIAISHMDYVYKALMKANDDEMAHIVRDLQAVVSSRRGPIPHTPEAIQRIKDIIEATKQ
jgi:hypothetical protein